MDLPPRCVIGSYRLDRETSCGSHGVVTRAWRPNVGRMVALKVLSGRGPQAHAAFPRENQATANVAHGGVRQVCDVLEIPADRPQFAIQLVDTSPREMLCRFQ
jgi:serine/threonine protein kinase